MSTYPWENIGVDFIGPLPESRDRDASRQNHNAKQVAELVFSEVYRLHRLPKSIVSDRDTLFTSAFWQHFIGIKLKMSSAYDPESDGST